MRFRLKWLNKQFEKLNLEDFIRRYTNRSQDVRIDAPSRSELDSIFADMGKDTEDKKHIDCSCCGYESCKLMATAIHNGFNVKENCIHYIKDLAEKERAEITKLVDEILFIEVKSGTSALSAREKSVKEAIENHRVRYVEYRVQ